MSIARASLEGTEGSAAKYGSGMSSGKLETPVHSLDPLVCIPHFGRARSSDR